jgi:hypothetical protein
MKLLSILLNIALILVGLFLVLEKGFPTTAERVAFVFLIFIFLTPLMNLLYIFFWSVSKDWLSLYLKREDMEEKEIIGKFSRKK